MFLTGGKFDKVLLFHCIPVQKCSPFTRLRSIPDCKLDHVASYTSCKGYFISHPHTLCADLDALSSSQFTDEVAI